MLQLRPLVLSCTAVLFCAQLAEQTPAAADGVVIDVTKPQRSKYPLAIPLASTGDRATAAKIQEVASFDLGIAGWFRVMDPSGFLANLEAEGLGIDVDSWKNVGAFGVIKYRSVVAGGNIQIDFKLFEIEKGNNAVLQRSYRGSASDVRKFTHLWCNEVVKHLTGENGFFGSKIALVTKNKTRGKRIVAMDFDGAGAYSVTKNSSINILPAWSPDGSQIAFTSYYWKNPDVYVKPAGGGKARRVSRRRGLNAAGSWSPDGSRLAVTLSYDGDPEIFIIRASDGGIVRKLTNNRYIDTSPAWSPNGREIAFVSDREGGPQIFVMNADGSNQRRVSMNGSYNTTPTWSPRKDQRVVAYTTRDGGNFDIVSLDLDSGKMVRITQNEGTNEEPSFAPNGRAIAFSSSRPGGAGIYIANADGTGNAVRVYKGYVTSIDWGPAPVD